MHHLQFTMSYIFIIINFVCRKQEAKEERPLPFRQLLLKIKNTSQSLSHSSRKKNLDHFCITDSPLIRSLLSSPFHRLKIAKIYLCLFLPWFHFKNWTAQCVFRYLFAQPWPNVDMLSVSLVQSSPWSTKQLVQYAENGCLLKSSNHQKL